MIKIALYAFLALFIVFTNGWVDQFRQSFPGARVLDSNAVPRKRPLYLRVVGLFLGAAIVLVVVAAMRPSLTDAHPSERAFAYGAITGAGLAGLWLALERSYLLWCALVAALIGVAGRLLLS